jgi:hypothetical protein
MERMVYVLLVRIGALRRAASPPSAVRSPVPTQITLPAARSEVNDQASEVVSRSSGKHRMRP